jgi:hypothetical protein
VPISQARATKKNEENKNIEGRLIRPAKTLFNEGLRSHTTSNSTDMKVNIHGDQLTDITKITRDQKYTDW